jgi:hypothetical protein
MNSISTSAALILAVGASSAVIANMLTLIMIGQVNRNLPETEQISYVLWNVRKVFRHHKRYFPGSWLPYACVVSVLVMFACFVGLVWRLGLLR